MITQKFEENKGLCLGNNDESNKLGEISIQEAKSKDDSATDEPFLLASQKSEKNQGWYLGNDDENNEINESLCLILFVYVCFIIKVFTIAMKTTVACVWFFGVVTSLVCFIIYYKSFTITMKTTIKRYK